MAFIRVPGNPEPQGAEELWLEGRGGVKLRAMFAPALPAPSLPVSSGAAGAAPRGTVILASGRTEFIEKYFEVVGELQARGFCVITMDWRGQGLSDRSLPDRLKGHFDSVDDCVNDIAQLVKAQAARLPRPHIVLAHSMGGGIMLRALQTRRLEVEGAVFCAPMWGIKSLGDFARGFARFMASVGAGQMFSPGVERAWKREKFQKNVVTHDRERFARSQGLVTAEPQLALAGPTLGWVSASIQAIEGFQEQGALGHLKIPVLVISAGEEMLVDNDSHATIAASLPQATHVTVPGARHEVMMEVDAVRAQFWALVDPLMDRVAPRVPVA